jgi:hypothetical protein
MVVEKIRKWAEVAQKELGSFVDVEHPIAYAKALHENGLLRYVELPEDSGVVAFIIVNDFCGNKQLQEVFMYIRPEFRGNPRNLIRVVKIMEDAAKENACKSIAIGSNIGYRDDKVLYLLSRLGYKTGTVIKEI